MANEQVRKHLDNAQMQSDKHAAPDCISACNIKYCIMVQPSQHKSIIIHLFHLSRCVCAPCLKRYSASSCIGGGDNLDRRSIPRSFQNDFIPKSLAL